MVELIDIAEGEIMFKTIKQGEQLRKGNGQTLLP